MPPRQPFASDALLQLALEATPLHFFWKDADLTFLGCNRAFAMAAGFESPGEIIGLRSEDLPWSAEETARFHESDRQVMETGRPVRDQISTLHRGDGWIMDIALTKFPVLDGRGDVAGIFGFYRDISSEIRAENQRSADEARLKRAARLAGLGHYVWDLKAERFEYCSEELARIHGLTREEFMRSGMTKEQDLMRLHPDDRERYLAAFQEAVETDTALVLDYRILRPDGSVRYVREIEETLSRPEEDARFSEGIILDITDQRAAEARVEQSEDRLKRAAKMAGLGIYVWDLVNNRCEFCSEEYAAIHGLSVEEYMASYADTQNDMSLIHPDDLQRYSVALAKSLRENEPLDVEYRILTATGDVRHVWEVEEKIEYDAGRQVRTEGILLDITERKLAEERLLQAQKIEAVGQLTGGLAHDFNNLLAVIQGNAELLLEALSGDPALTRLTEPVERAARRGAELTQRLLAFSRKQPLRPQAVAVADLVEGMLDLLTRTLGAEIVIETGHAPDLWAAQADPGQLENALLNLAINARDALPGGGRLHIDCANHRQEAGADEALPPGDYIALSVRDDGIGMTPEVRARAFEPFYTTKEVGKGSGLGLSMVYGFAKQSGGHVSLESAENMGTTVRLFLPRADVPVSAPPARAAVEVPAGQGEAVLVVEDDPDIRALALNMLGGLGYRARGVADAAAARAVLNSGAPVDVLLSDVMLPGGVRGTEFAEYARRLLPDLPVVFMTGFASAAARAEHAKPGTALLSKPFDRAGLAKALRQVLG